MKKLLQVSAVLLAAVLMFAGCKNNADEGESLPGTWVSSLDYNDDWQKNNWTVSKNKITYNCSNVSSLGIENDHYRTYCAWVANKPQIYGVRAKIKQNTFTKAEPGIMLFETSSNDKFDAYYSLTFYKGSYTLFEKLSGQEPTCLSKSTDDEGTYTNTWHDSIKQEGNENEVLFYTDGDKLVLKVNGSTVTTIDKKLDAGNTWVCMDIPSNAASPINASWEILEFQTAK